MFSHIYSWTDVGLGGIWLSVKSKKKKKGRRRDTGLNHSSKEKQKGRHPADSTFWRHFGPRGSSPRNLWYWPLDGVLVAGQPVARGGHLLDLVDVAGVGGVRGVAVFHDHDVPPAGGRGQGLGGRGGQLGQDGRVSCAEVAAAAFGARQLGSTVVVVDALGRGPPQFMEAVEVVGHVGKVCRGPCPSESAQLVMRGLKHLLENCLLKVWLPVHILFTRLFDLHNDRNDNEDDDNAGSHANDSPTGVGQLVQQAGFPLL